MTYTAYISLTADEAAQLHYAIVRRKYPIITSPPLPPPSHRAGAAFLQLSLQWQRCTTASDRHLYTTYKLIVTDITALPRYFTAYLNRDPNLPA